MTRFVDVSAVARIINRVGPEKFLAGLTTTMREDFRRWESFEKCARVASHSENGVIELMPIADEHLYAFKYVNGHPSNTAKGVPTVMAFGALADVKTGLPTLLSELTLLTAFRTAAASSLAAEVLARPGSRVMGMVGCGAQGEFQAIAFHTLIGIEEIRVFDIDARAMDKFMRNLAYLPELKVIPVESAAAAVSGADIVTTCTADKNWATILTPDMVEPGMHVNAIGGDCPGKTELHVDVLRAAKVFVEYEPQTRIEGDIQQLSADHPVHDLWRVIAEQRIGRERDDQITVFDSVGFALEDYSSLRYIQLLATEYDEGIDIELIPELLDPKNLFAQVIDVTD
jgi:ornithine cyclodeaminase